MAMAKYTTMQLTRDWTRIFPADLHPVANHLMLVLCNEAWIEKGYTLYTSRPNIAKLIGRDVKTTTKYLDILEALGWIVQEKTDLPTYTIEVNAGEVQRRAVEMRTARDQKRHFAPPVPLETNDPDVDDVSASATDAHPAAHAPMQALIDEIGRIPALKAALGDAGLRRISQDQKLSALGEDECLRRLGALTGEQIQATANAKKSPAGYLVTCLLGNTHPQASPGQAPENAPADRLYLLLGADDFAEYEGWMRDVPHPEQDAALARMTDRDFHSIEIALNRWSKATEIVQGLVQRAPEPA